MALLIHRFLTIFDGKKCSFIVICCSLGILLHEITPELCVFDTMKVDLESTAIMGGVFVCLI